MMKKVYVIHGPNINLTGVRQTDIYGREDLAAINEQIAAKAAECGFACEVFHSNHEGAIVDTLQKAREEAAGVVINAGAYTHYSYAIRDAIALLTIPCVEVHLSNVYARDEFRKTSVIAPVCVGTVAGFGKHSYFLALLALAELIK